jgi:predicted Zn-dependent protease
VSRYGKAKKADMRRSAMANKEEKKLKLETKGPLAPQYPSIQMLILSGQLDSAGKEIEKLLVKNPHDEDALWLMADVLIRQDSKKEAKKILKRLVDSQGSYARNAKKRMKEL